MSCLEDSVASVPAEEDRIVGGVVAPTSYSPERHAVHPAQGGEIPAAPNWLDVPSLDDARWALGRDPGLLHRHSTAAAKSRPGFGQPTCNRRAGPRREWRRRGAEDLHRGNGSTSAHIHGGRPRGQSPGGSATDGFQPARAANTGIALDQWLGLSGFIATLRECLALVRNPAYLSPSSRESMLTGLWQGFRD